MFFYLAIDYRLYINLNGSEGSRFKISASADIYIFEYFWIKFGRRQIKAILLSLYCCSCLYKDIVARGSGCLPCDGVMLLPRLLSDSIMHPWLRLPPSLCEDDFDATLTTHKVLSCYSITNARSSNCCWNECTLEITDTHLVVHGWSDSLR